MNKPAIKNYAIWARVNLIEAAKQRAYQYEITKDNITDAGADVVSGKPITKEEKEQRRQLIDQIKLKGFDQVMEEVAYTWFNRFIALRFMEVNGYLPTKIRVFTDSEDNFKPEILKEALTVELPVDKARVMELLEKQDNEELYKMLLIAQCNELSNGLPDMFEVISNYTELLFPNNLLKEDSVLGEMVNSIPEEDWTDAVQIIGWLYQYYNSELKDETFALLKKNVKISKERIPAATQLFTPDWIVRYMVENSLGRLWYEGHPNDEIKKEWKYYLDEAQQEPEVDEQLKVIREEYKAIKPEDIKVIDPCMGSGHILVYAFDVLMQIYTSAGWSERDAAESILENNLYGLDIDDRAGQLAYFAVMMKARKYNRKILTRNIRPKVYSIQESNNVIIEAWWRLGPEEDVARRLVQDLTDAKEYGSILNLSVNTEELHALRKRLDDIEEMSDQGNLLDVIQSDEITRQLYPLVDLAEVMVQKYDVVVTNPPYMGNGSMSSKLANYVKKFYPNGKADLFAVFIDKCNRMNSAYRFQAMITQHSWMFLSKFEKLRASLDVTVVNMVHLGARAFEDISGEVVQTASFVLRSTIHSNYTGTYVRLVDFDSENDKRDAYLEKNSLYYCKQSSFDGIPGNIYAYWISPCITSLLKDENKLDSYGEAKQGLSTTDNGMFLRLWYEINFNRIDFDCRACEEIKSRKTKWFPYNKAGKYQKWNTIDEYVVNYENDGEEIKRSVMTKYPYLKNPDFVVKNTDSYFRHGITWNDVSTGSFCCRYVPDGYIFADAGPMFFSNDDYLYLGYFNSIVFQKFADIICQGLHYSTGHIPKIPYAIASDDNNAKIRSLVTSNLSISKENCDYYETSWDFKKNPLI